MAKDSNVSWGEWREPEDAVTEDELRRKSRNNSEAFASRVFEDYRRGIRFKEQLGRRGMYDQNKMNERYLVGDQWHGVNCGADRPLVRHNVIKRIADYKIAVVSSNPVAVNYSAEGVPNTLHTRDSIRKLRDGLADGDKAAETVLRGMVGFGGSVGSSDSPMREDSAPEEIPTDEEINLVMAAMSDYFKVTAERLKLDTMREEALRNAYTSGTGILYTWWDERIRTGLYASEKRDTPITGDIACEVLDVENVYFGDPNLDDIQGQPYIIVAQRKNIGEIRREARRYGVSEEDVLKIKSDRETGAEAGQLSENEPDDSQKAVVLTKFMKDWDKEGKDFTIKAVKVCEKVIVRPVWDTQIRLYPFAKFCWERRRNCAYGESEITYLIPNQIAINRMITACVWATMMMGMPMMLVNRDVITEEITNDPGQVVPITGGPEDVAGALRFVNPPSFSNNFDNMANSLIANTLMQSGANEAALGDVRPDNTSAIIAVREAATLPMQVVQNRYYNFCEDMARIWAEFWVMKYGKRSLKMEDDNGVWYFPFDGDRYKDFLVSTRIDVGSSTLWGETQSIQTLDALFDKQIIDTVQYLKRLPKGIVPNVTGLIRELEAANEAAAGMPAPGAAPMGAVPEGMPPMDMGAMPPMSNPEAGGPPDLQALLSMLPPGQQEMFMALPPEQQQAMIMQALGG